MAVIELGLVQHSGDEPAAAAARRPLGRRDLRRLLVALVALGCVLTVTGSARPAPQGLPRLWSTPFDPSRGMFTMTTDSVYVLSRPGAAQLTAYDLATGAVRWSRPSPEDADWVSDVRAGVLLLPGAQSTAQYVDADGSKIVREYNRDTLALDTRTGRQLWRQSGELLTTTGDRALLNVWEPNGHETVAIRMVRLSDGKILWTRPHRGIQSLFTDDSAGTDADRAVTISETGRTEVLNLADGSVVATAMLPWRSGSSPESDFTAVTLAGDRLYLDRNRGEQATITVYDSRTLGKLWSVGRTAPGGIYDCGPLVCVATTSRIFAHDRQTGAVHWQIDSAAGGFPLADGVLMVDDEDENGLRHRLVDATTGRLITELGAGLPVWDLQRTHLPYLVARTAQPPGRTKISRLDVRSGATRLLGVLPPLIDYGCQTDGTVIACVTTDEQLIVTDVG